MNSPVHNFDVLVVGGGPAGIAAAARAAECGVRVGLVDDNPRMGGQIWRSGIHRKADTMARDWLTRLERSSATIVGGARVFAQPKPGVLLAEGSDSALVELRYKKLVLAAGARERFLPFPGWTLLNVFGAGGLQALVKNGLPVRGKRVIVAGSGPLLLAVAAFLRRQGAEVPVICEQASRGSMISFGLHVVRQPGKIAQALRLRQQVAGSRFLTGAWITSAQGLNKVESVTIRRGKKEWSLPCDYLACGFHLVPNTELASLLGCAVGDGGVKVDRFQRTDVAGILCAGEPTGIAGVESAVLQGQIAGLVAADREGDAGDLIRKLEASRAFARALDQSFSLRPELRNLPKLDTIVCRCEDVRYGDLCDYTSWRSAKLYTRCGMGPCQGRICGAAMQFLRGWDSDSVRPPIFPARLRTLASPGEVSNSVTTGVKP